MTESEALQKAIEIVGSATALASALDLTKGAISQWKDEGRKIPAEHCPTIERVTAGQVKCEDLRPDVDWSVLRASPGPQTPMATDKRQ
ncbi:transcriptional regulator [Noviherbaspirillum saxi]|uniref:Cro/Cl family transcriptional regulator n=1 Tax=Noviherbaspirillum saxi TaxID=2320863 RepID=A0A3A3FWN3_9BURK|nr:Cro/Cl family transcriptional regulator [Noviherbaspirillum saxi]